MILCLSNRHYTHITFACTQNRHKNPNNVGSLPGDLHMDTQIFPQGFEWTHISKHLMIHFPEENEITWCTIISQLTMCVTHWRRALM